MMRRYGVPSVLTLGMILFGGGWYGVPASLWAQATAPVTVVPTLVRQAPFGAGCMPDSSQCDAVHTSTLVFRDVVLPSVQPLVEVQMEDAVRASAKDTTGKPGKPLPRVFGGLLRYERVNLDTRQRGLEGDVYSITLQQQWDIERFTTGVLLQDDIVSLQRLDAHRIGVIAYGQYTHQLLQLPPRQARHSVLGPDTTHTPFAVLTTTLNANYIHTAIAGDVQPDVNTFGGGLSTALSLDWGTYVLGSAVSYQVYTDDQKQGNDPQHLFKIGLQTGVRLFPSVAFTVSGSWTYDATHYRQLVDSVDTNYFDLVADVVWNLTPIVRLTGGYRKVLGFNHVTSDMLFLGTLLRF